MTKKEMLKKHSRKSLVQWTVIGALGLFAIGSIVSAYVGAAQNVAECSVAGACVFEASSVMVEELEEDSIGSTRFPSGLVVAGVDAAANNTSDLGGYSAAWKDVYASGTVYVSNLIGNGDNVGIASSTPSASLSVGSVETTTTTLDFSKPCFRFDVGGVDVYYYPSSAALGNAATSGWATSTVSCF